MGTLLIILVLASATLAFVAAIFALRAGLKLHRTRAALQSHLSSEVTHLTRRTTELEENLAALDARLQALPIRVSELQQNLATLRVLTNALGTSLRQVQRILSSTDLKSSLARPLVEAFQALRNGGSDGPVGIGRKGGVSRP
jgi:predicted  nucleic acid-binding Zn-ribbon protein